MLKQIMIGAACVSTLFLGSCKATLSVTDSDGSTMKYEGEIDPWGGEPADRTATSLGRGTAVMEDGTELEGEFFDTNGDGQPDKFKPDAGQSSDSVSGETNGDDWYDIEDLQQKTVRPQDRVSRGEC